MKRFALAALSSGLAMAAASAGLAADAPPVPTVRGHPFVCTDYTQGKVFVVSADGRVE